MQAELAAREDIEGLRLETKAAVVELCHEIRHACAELHQELENMTPWFVKRLAILLFLQAILIVALVKLLPGPTG